MNDNNNEKKQYIFCAKRLGDEIVFATKRELDDKGRSEFLLRVLKAVQDYEQETGLRNRVVTIGVYEESILATHPELAEEIDRYMVLENIAAQFPRKEDLDKDTVIKNLEYHGDEDMVWLRVSMDEIRRLRIENEITCDSYMHGNYVFLSQGKNEETYKTAYAAYKKYRQARPRKVVFKPMYHIARRDSRIRNYEEYNAETMLAAKA